MTMSVPRFIHIDDKTKGNFRDCSTSLDFSFNTYNYAKSHGYIYPLIYMYNRILNIGYFCHCKGMWT